MPFDFGIQGTSIQQLDEINEDLFGGLDDDGKEKPQPPKTKPTPAKPTAGKEGEKEEEEKEEEEVVLSDDEATDSLFGEEKKTTKKQAAAEESIEEDEEITDTEEDADDGNDENDDDEEEELSDFEAMTKGLYELGIFEADEDEEGNPVYRLPKTPEQLKAVWEEQKAKALDTSLYNFLMNRHGEEGVRVFQAIFQNGVNPKEYFQAYTQLQEVESLNPEDEAHQEMIVREYLKRQKLPEDKIAKRIQRLKDLAELQSEAEDLHPQLVEQDKQALLDKEEANKQKQLAEEQADAQYKGAITKILQEKLKEKEIDGIPLSQERVQKAFDFLYTKKYTSKATGDKLTEFDVAILNSKKPENLQNRIKLALLFMDNFDFSKIQKKGVSNASNNVFKDLVIRKKTGVTNTSKKKSIEAVSPWTL